MYSISEIATMMRGKRDCTIDLKNSMVNRDIILDARDRNIKFENAYMKKYIFLDIDGVLNNEYYTELCYKKWGRNTPFFCENVPFDPDSLTQLAYLCSYIRFKGDEPYIVLTSSWRLNATDMAVAAARLAEYNIKINDITTKDMNLKRGQQIKEYLDKIEQSVDFTIIDDEMFDIENYFLDELVLVDPQYGFTSKEKTKAEEILYKVEKDYNYKV